VIELTLYSRPDCHLCDQMVDALAPALEGRAEIRIVDISTDPELERKYGRSIPVLAAGDLELSRYRLDRDRLERFFGGQD
jgi:hypothetical protein